MKRLGLAVALVAALVIPALGAATATPASAMEVVVHSTFHAVPTVLVHEARYVRHGAAHRAALRAFERHEAFQQRRALLRHEAEGARWHQVAWVPAGDRRGW